MAEAALFSVAGKLLSTLASPKFKEAYKRIESIQGAKDDLAHLMKTIQALEAVLLDAEKRQEDSAAVKIWVKRVRDVLYDAEDVFDRIATVDLVKKQRGEKLTKKVQTYFSPSLNPFFCKKYIADQIKAIREELGRIDSDMKVFNFVPRSCGGETGGFRGERRETGAYVNPNKVIGRDDDKKAILGFLLDESNSQQDVSIVAIVGIGGMGKTTLAQLVVRNEEVRKKFSNPWWACISDEPRKKQVLVTILQSMYGGRDLQNSTMSQLQDQIRECVSRRGKYLLVLDDLWDEDYDRCSELRELLSSSNARGSKIIVTTRSSSVAEAITADKVHLLKGLSEDEKWDLFKMVAITPKREKDPRWICLGREIAEMCADVPLAVKSIAGLLRTKTTLQEWESFKNDELSKLSLNNGTTVATLKLSYDHLKPSLKQCFAYCSVFPKDHRIDKQKLIYLWIAQGYIADEYEGHGYVMELLGIYFLESSYSSKCYKMHDLVHDLALLVAGDGVTSLPGKLDQCADAVRHLSIDSYVGDSWEFPPVLLNANRLRSCLFGTYGELKPLVLDQQLIKFMFLRALDLSHLSIRVVPDRIGELLNLRYLNLSSNDFSCLPGSITKLLNLITLDVSYCNRLEALPNDFRKLISLRHLIVDEHTSLKHMPPGFREMTEMRQLDYFIVDDATGSSRGNGPDALAQMKKLRGKLQIQFSKEVDGWVEDALVSGLSGLSASIDELVLSDYPGMRILSLPTNLVVLELSGCKKLIHLPPLERFRYLVRFKLSDLDELEYIEGDGCNSVSGQGFTTTAGSSSSCLRKLELVSLPKLKGWSRKDQPLTLRLDEASASLEYLRIRCCGTLRKLCFPPANVLEELDIAYCEGLEFGDEEEKRAVDWDSLPKLRRLHLLSLPGLRSFEVQALNSLQSLDIGLCSQLKSVSLPLKHLNVPRRLQNPGCVALELRTEDLTSLASVSIVCCFSLKKIHLPSSYFTVLADLTIRDCPELLMGKNPTNLEWASLRNLQVLSLAGFPELESFSAEALTSLRSLSISRCRSLNKLCLRSKNCSVLEHLWLNDCPELELWEEDERRGMDLDFLSNLTKLSLNRLPQLECFQGEASTSLRHLSFFECNHLKSVKLPPRDLNVIEELEFRYCGEMELWKEETRGVDWDSLPNLRKLGINGMPKPERLPDCLQQRRDNRNLTIFETPLFSNIQIKLSSGSEMQ